MKADDAELLYSAGMTSLITRKPKESREYFARYLEVSNTLEVNRRSGRRSAAGCRRSSRPPLWSRATRTGCRERFFPRASSIARSAPLSSRTSDQYRRLEQTQDDLRMGWGEAQIGDAPTERTSTSLAKENFVRLRRSCAPGGMGLRCR